MQPTHESRAWPSIDLTDDDDCVNVPTAPPVQRSSGASGSGSCQISNTRDQHPDGAPPAAPPSTTALRAPTLRQSPHEAALNEDNAAREVAARQEAAAVPPADAPAAVQQGQAVRPPKPPTAATACAPAPRLLQLQDPAQAGGLLYLGDIHLPVKARKGFTIKGLAQALAPHGLVHPCGGPHVAGAGAPSSLHDLFDAPVTVVAGRSKAWPTWLRLLALPSPPEESMPISCARVRQVTVSDCQGRFAPLVVRLEVTDVCCVAEAQPKLEALLQPPLATGERLEWFMVTPVPGDSEPGVQSLHLTAHAFSASARVKTYVYRLPHASTSAAVAADSAPAVALAAANAAATAAAAAAEAAAAVPLNAGGGSQVAPPPTQVALEAAAAQDALEALKAPCLALLFHSCRDAAGQAAQLSVEAAEDVDKDSQLRPGTVAVLMFGVPLLIPIPAEHRNADVATLRQVLTPSVHRALTWACPLGQLPLTVHTGRVCCTLTHNGYLSGFGVGRKLSAMRQAPLVGVMTAWWHNGLPEGLCDPAIMTGAAVDMSTTDAAVNESVQLDKLMAARVTATQARRTRPTEVAAELRIGSYTQAPPAVAAARANGKAALPPSAHPYIAVTTSLRWDDEAVAYGRAALVGEAVAEAEDRRVALAAEAAPAAEVERAARGPVPSERLGVVAFQVYVWRDADSLAPHRMVLRAHDDYGGYHNIQKPNNKPFFPAMRATLEALTAAAPGAERLNAMLADAKLHGAARGITTISGLMNFMKSDERPAAQQPEGLTVAMHPYQLQTLQFMQDVEKAEGGYRSMFWRAAQGPRGDTYYYSPALDQLSLTVPDMGTGGFLAETMGLGKTIEVLALILAMPAPKEVVAGAALPGGKLQSRANLVICSVSLVGQWCSEAQTRNTGGVRMYQHYGPKRAKASTLLQLATMYDLVVTTYETLAADFRNCNNGAPIIAGIHWHRIVLDEGHKLRDPTTQATLAVLQLSSGRRWMCTGTPINTKVEDLCSEFGAIGLMPLGDRAYFNDRIRPSYNNHSAASNEAHTSPGCAPLSLLFALRAVLIRHTHEQKLGGRDVLRLPPKTDEVVHVHLNAAERATYLRVNNEVHDLWEKPRPGQWSRSCHLLAFQPLRLICSGGQLGPAQLRVPQPATTAAPTVPDIVSGLELGELRAPEGDDCSICLEPPDQPAMTRCRHWFCRECILSVLATGSSTCPLCRANITKEQLREPNPEPTGANGLLADSKLRALVDQLRAMTQADPTAKALVFTQFSGTMEWLTKRLAEEGFGFRCITGSMPCKQRAAAIDAFNNDPLTTVFLLSLRSAGVGINLTAANHVFLLEPCINAALEEQAIGRAWRMGQRRPVVVKRLVVQGSVEESIRELVKMRRAAGGSSAAVRAPRTTGSFPADQVPLNNDELKLLFQPPRLAEVALVAPEAAAQQPE